MQPPCLPLVPVSSAGRPPSLGIRLQLLHIRRLLTLRSDLPKEEKEPLVHVNRMPRQTPPGHLAALLLVAYRVLFTSPYDPPDLAIVPVLLLVPARPFLQTAILVSPSLFLTPLHPATAVLL